MVQKWVSERHVTAVGAVELYGQCGGLGYEGSTACDDGAICEFRNEYYSQVGPHACS